MRDKRSGDRISIVGNDEPFAVSTIKRIEGTIVTTASGTAHNNLASLTRIQLTRELDDEPRDWIFDASGIVKFDRSAITPFVDIFGSFKMRNGKRVIFVTENDGVKMLLSSVGMSSVASNGPAIEIVPTLSDALTHIPQKRMANHERSSQRRRHSIDDRKSRWHPEGRNPDTNFA